MNTSKPISINLVARSNKRALRAGFARLIGETPAALRLYSLIATYNQQAHSSAKPQLTPQYSQHFFVGAL